VRCVHGLPALLRHPSKPTNDSTVAEPSDVAGKLNKFCFQRKNIPDRTFVSSPKLVNMQVSQEAWTLRTLAELGLSLVRREYDQINRERVEWSDLIVGLKASDNFNETRSDQSLVLSGPPAVKSHLSDHALQVTQDARLDLLELFADFFPNTLLQNCSFFAFDKTASLSNSAVTEILTVGLLRLAGSVHERSATVLCSPGEEQLVEPEDPRHRASDFTGELAANCRQFTRAPDQSQE
jgi:hypothetical protein